MENRGSRRSGSCSRGCVGGWAPGCVDGWADRCSCRAGRWTALLDLGAGLLDVDPDHPGQLPGERLHLGLVADAGDQSGGGAHGVDPSVGAVEVEAADDVGEHEAVERNPPRDELAHGRVTLLDPQVARVEAVRLDGDVGLGHEVLVTVERPQRGLLARGVAVEGEDHLAAELLVVVQEAAQDPGMVVAERRTAGGDRRGHSRQVAGHHVGVALHHHRLGGAGHVAPRQVDAVEHLALLVDRRLGGVEVLRLDPVVVEDPARPEPDRVAAGVADRPQQASAETVVGRAPHRHEPAGDHLVVAEALLPQVGEQGVAVARGEADPEPVGRRLVEAALVQELPGHQRVGGGELPGVELLRHPVGLDQPAAGGPLGPLVADVTVLAPQLHAVLVGEALDRLHEADPVDLHQEREDVAAFLAAEAVEELAGRGDMERRRLLVVEGAEPLLGAAAGVAQRHVGGDDVVDGRLLAHLGDVFLANPAGHGAESTAATGTRPPASTAGRR